MSKEDKKLDYFSQLDEVEKKIKEGFEGKILTVEEATSKEYFGESAQYRDRNGFKVTVKLTDAEGEFTEFFSKPDPRGLHKSKIYDFKKKYGSWIKPGIAVHVVLGGDGFYQIEI